MEKQQKELLITGILVVVFLLVAVNSCQKIRKKNQQKKQYEEMAAAPAIQSVTVKTMLPEKNIDIAGEGEEEVWSRDPFSGKEYRTEKSSGDALVFSGVMWDDSSPVAIINGKMYEEGDSVGRFTVFEINEDSVVLFDGEDELELKVW